MGIELLDALQGGQIGLEFYADISQLSSLSTFIDRSKVGDILRGSLLIYGRRAWSS